MAKTQIYQQEEALSVYFRDMLAEPKPVEEKPSPAIAMPQSSAMPVEPAPVITEDSESDTQAQQAETTAVASIHKLLLCQISGMKLAFDVSALSNIVHWPASGLNQLPGRKGWQLGLYRDREQHIEVVDIRHLLQTTQHDTDQPGYILLINERRTGIACDGISQIITIDADQVNWRRDTTQRRWFRGVIADSMHSIIDLPALFSALENNEMA